MRILTTVSVFVLSFCLIAASFAQEEGKGEKRGRRGAEGRQQEGQQRGQQRGRMQRGQGQRGGQQRGGFQQRGDQQRGFDVGRMFQAMDKNQDGKLTKEELPPRMQQGFNRIDANGDSVIDRQELRQLANLMRGMQGQQGRGQQGRGQRGMRRGGDGEQGQGQRRQFDAGQMLKRMDKNNDGKITKDEMPERMQERFEQLDSNGDGAVDAAEFKTAMERRMQRGGGGQGQQRKRGNGGEQKGSVKPKRPGK